MIRIKYSDGRYDMVKASHLDHLIVTRQISGFKRQSGWVVLGRDPIRNRGKQVFYLGPERREPMGPRPKTKGDCAASRSPGAIRA